jgi:hypothetical protein
MYTGLRAKLVIKEEFRPVIERLMDPASEGSWYDVTKAFPQYPFLAEWVGVWRSDFIPFGALAYMPWDDEDPDWQRSFKDGLWVFQCSLKNYDDEIEFFVAQVLSRIVDERHELYSLYEENEEPTQLFIPEVDDE